MSRDELNPRQLAELAALDRILAREPVDEEHLELAALVDSVRAGAPRMEAEFERRLETQIPRRRGHLPRPRGRRLALAGGTVLAGALALTIVISAGLLGGGGSGNPPAAFAPRLAQPSGASHAFAVAPGGAAARAPGVLGGPSSSPAVPGLSSPGRLVRRASTLTLATSPATMQGVANAIVAATEREHGVVESSSIDTQGHAGSASFSLAVPSTRLGSLIAALSALANVRALTQSTQDITDGYNLERALLADRVAERAALLKQLATAATAAAVTSIRRQVDGLGARIAAEHRAVDRSLGQGRTGRLEVYVVPGPSAKHSTTAGPLTRAFHDAEHALEEILAIALIALAIALPFALCALALWWAGSALRQRARERAMRTA